ncbi:MAG: hypothetical protein LBI03_02280, partial [Clostridiales bacterium]|nr:hypothetical protein [Clostridiales bacterium]
MELTKETVLELIKSGGYTPMTSVEILTRLEVPLEEINKFNLLLEELVNEGLIYKSKKRKYALPSVFGIAVGELKLNARGFGFLVPEEDVWDGDIYIAAKDMNGAADGDRVVAEVLTEKDNGSRHYGKIERIIKRGSEVIIGVLSIYGDNGVVTPDDPKFSHSIYIEKNNL